MTESDKERFSMRVCVDEVRISADVYIDSGETESAAELELIVPDKDYQVVKNLYDHLCQFALIYGENLQGLFQTDRYNYMSCFIRDVSAFRSEFEQEEVLKPLFSHDKGETAHFILSFPEIANYEGKEPVKKAFIDIIQKHVVTLNDYEWGAFVEQALSGSTVGCGINIKTGEVIDYENERDTIIKLTREEFVKSNLTDSFESRFYVRPLFTRAEVIGEIEGHSVWFSSSGYYFYWNQETEYMLESWLTFPAYPYGW